jgi:hypothetical protein
MTTPEIIMITFVIIGCVLAIGKISNAKDKRKGSCNL